MGTMQHRNIEVELFFDHTNGKDVEWRKGVGTRASAVPGRLCTVLREENGDRAAPIWNGRAGGRAL